MRTALAALVVAVLWVIVHAIGVWEHLLEEDVT